MKIIQWNAKSLAAHGSEFSKYISDLSSKPDIICIQETWLKCHNHFRIPGYTLIRRDRECGSGGGFVKIDVPFIETDCNVQLECNIIKLPSTREVVTIVNFYNPCRPLINNILQWVLCKCEGVILLCGDLNSLNYLWGSKLTDRNSECIISIIDDLTWCFYMMVLGLLSIHLLKKMGMARQRPLEYWRKVDAVTRWSGACSHTWPDLIWWTWQISPLDLTFVSTSAAARCEWTVSSDSMGSAHFQVITCLKWDRSPLWNFSKANWDSF